MSDGQMMDGLMDGQIDGCIDRTKEFIEEVYQGCIKSGLFSDGWGIV